ncbi:hypothetical protein C8R44DRAFT_749661 [Mycena epipterygia]|nr:hypothetical protein C8R44DRAFT_749661 [Mycena epipterygia]
MSHQIDHGVTSATLSSLARFSLEPGSTWYLTGICMSIISAALWREGSRRPLKRKMEALRHDEQKWWTLQKLFGGAEKPHTRKPSAQVTEKEILMKVLAEAAKDNNPDDRAIEIQTK